MKYSLYKSLRAGGLMVAGLAASATALALPANTWQPGRSPVLNVYYGGATATDNVLERIFLISGTGGICRDDTGGVANNTTIDIYRVTTSNRVQRVVFCNARAGISGITAGTPIAFHKESIGGSSNGIVPHIDPTPTNGVDNRPQLAFYNMASAGSCTQSDGDTATAGIQPFTATGLIPWREWVCAESISNQFIDGGISDTEGNLSFPAPNLTQLNTQVLQTRGLGIVFGVPVSLNLYRSLQRAQGLALDDTQANVPSLTRSQIRGLYTGGIVDWNALTNSTGTPLADVVGNDPVNAAAGGVPDSNVFVCRRVSSSGTQASFESYWLQQRCDATRGATAAPSFLVPDDGSTATVGAPANAANGFVNGSESSTDVRACLNYHNTNGTWAIGVLSTEVTSSNLTSGNFRMVRVDGALPNLASVANGDYDFFTENVTARRRPGQLNAPTGTVLSVLQHIESNLSRPTVLTLINNNFRGRPWGDGGVLSIPSTAFLPNTPPAVDGVSGPGTMRDNPVNTMSRSFVGGIVNNCNPPVMVNPSPAP